MATKINEQTYENAPSPNAYVPIAQPDGGGGYLGRSTLISDIQSVINPYKDWFVVAPSGGDYTSVRTAVADNAGLTGGELLLKVYGTVTETQSFNFSFAGNVTVVIQLQIGAKWVIPDAFNTTIDCDLIICGFLSATTNETFLIEAQSFVFNISSGRALYLQSLTIDANSLFTPASFNLGSNGTMYINDVSAQPRGFTDFQIFADNSSTSKIHIYNSTLDGVQLLVTGFATSGAVFVHYSRLQNVDSSAPVIPWVGASKKEITFLSVVDGISNVQFAGETISVSGAFVNGSSGTFTTVDGKTVTVTDGIVTSIV